MEGSLLSLIQKSLMIFTRELLLLYCLAQVAGFHLTEIFFFKFCCDHTLDELKQKSIASCQSWRAAGRPRSGPTFDLYRKDKAAYRNIIRSRQHNKKLFYTNDLHEA